MEFTNEDFLLALREAQDSSARPGPSFGEWRSDNFGKAQYPRASGAYSPGFGLMGHLNTSSRAPYGPPRRPHGDGGQNWERQFNVPSGGSPDLPSKYDSRRPDQPPPWIEDVNMSSVWYSPMEPVWPFGPPFYTVPREWDFPVGYNLNFIQPRIMQMNMLRGMRMSWGVLSTVIQTRKDQLLRLPWTIQVRDKPRATSRAVDEMRRFFRRPDGKLSYSQWTRKLLDDLFVIDAPSIFLDRDMGGNLRNAQVLDGATIFPLIDDAGRRPDTVVDVDDNGYSYERRQPAFQQIIYGLPMINLSEDELMYPMLNPRPEMPVIGYSPVEQIMTEAMEAIRKTFYQLEFWRAGSMPELMITVPDTWTPRQIATFQAHFDALLSGQLTLKSKVRFVPGGMKPFDIKNASGESLWSQRDELLVRLCCYAFSVSPTAFVKQTNRATANQAAETAQEEGLYPLMSWWKDDIMDAIIQDKFGYDEVEFIFLPRPTPDAEKQSKIYDLNVKEGIRTRNEIRAEMGLEPVKDGDYLTVTTGAAVVRLDQVIDGTASMMMPGQPKPPEGATPAQAKPTGASNLPIRGPARARNASTQPQPPKKPTTVHKIDAQGIADAADETDDSPSPIARKLGNYKKGKFSLHGLPISIENAKGSDRGEKDRFGIDRSVKMPAAYGYIRGTLGADGMQVDAYVGKHPESKTVWVIDQDKFDADGRDKGFDEHKVMLAYRSPKKALKDYLRSHYDGQGHERMAAMTEVSYDELKDWLRNGDMNRPISEAGCGHVVARRGVGNGLNKADTISQAGGLLWYDQTLAAPRPRSSPRQTARDKKDPHSSAKKGKAHLRRKMKRERKRSGPRWLTLKIGD